MTLDEAKNKERYAINRLQDAKDGYKEYLTDEAIDIAIKAIEQTRWIPVSERLPEEFESVLVCYKSQGGIAQTVSERLINMDGSNRWSALAGIKPIAWMPLPKPYKAKSEDKE